MARRVLYFTWNRNNRFETETNKPPKEELTEDLLSILHVFSERNNDLKKYKTEINKELKEINEKKEKRD